MNRCASCDRVAIVHYGAGRNSLNEEDTSTSRNQLVCEDCCIVCQIMSPPSGLTRQRSWFNEVDRGLVSLSSTTEEDLPD